MSDEKPPNGASEPGSGASIAVKAAVFAVVVGALVLALFGDIATPLVRRGADAPDFDLPRLDEGRITLGELEGRIVLVNFWATWCRPCEEEIPAMERLYEALAPDGFELVAVSVDQDRSEVEAFQRRLGISFPIALDPDQVVSRRYQTTGYPESLLVDASGRVVERYVGPRDWDHPSYVERIRRLMRGEAG